MPAFDDLSEEQKAKILEIADKEIARDNVVKEYTKAAQTHIQKEFKKFLSKDDTYSETQVHTKDLNYDKEKIIRVQNNSGQFIERAVVTFDNDYQLAITRPQQVYGSDPSLFDISPRKPDGELDTTLVDPNNLNRDIISAQSITDINNHMKTISSIDPNEENEENTENEESI